MYEYTLIHVAPDSTLPEPWQIGWGTGSVLALPSLPARDVARAPQGTPLPKGARPYTTPEVTDRMRHSVTADLQRIADGHDSLYAGLARGYLDGGKDLDRLIQCQLGLVHPYTFMAPVTVTSLDQASRQMTRAHGEWCSPCSCAVIRTAARGFDCWIGIGGMMSPAGHADTYPEAERQVLAASRAERSRAMQRVREKFLVGWHDDTPFFSATISTAERILPLSVHRGPMTGLELGKGEAFGSSWNLPIVAVYRGDEEVERHDDFVTWDDDASREQARERQRAGEARRHAEWTRALDLFEQDPALSGRIDRKRGRLVPGPLALDNREILVLGPVRMRDDGMFALALVQDGRYRYWMALSNFV